LGPFKVFLDFNAHLFSVPDVVCLNPSLHFREPFARSDSADQRAGDLQENINQSPAHRKVVVFELVPLRLSNNVLGGRSVNNNFVLISFSLVSLPVLLPH